MLWEQRVRDFIKSHRASNANVFHKKIEVEPPLSGQSQDNRRKFLASISKFQGKDFKMLQRYTHLGAEDLTRKLWTFQKLGPDLKARTGIAINLEANSNLMYDRCFPHHVSFSDHYYHFPAYINGINVFGQKAPLLL